MMTDEAATSMTAGAVDRGQDVSSPTPHGFANPGIGTARQCHSGYEVSRDLSLVVPRGFSRRAQLLDHHPWDANPTTELMPGIGARPARSISTCACGPTRGFEPRRCAKRTGS